MDELKLIETVFAEPEPTREAAARGVTACSAWPARHRRLGWAVRAEGGRPGCPSGVPAWSAPWR
ncbi:hypothetical protein [Nonomuraea diastatica]|uniref:Uncharacterized protein n=1 Tax=Nonomuraea diastatica TaxID=1848329 RepID=A0A4R4VLE6_9ACTN|nr:hypothetical protein [Nonomuraea diastatica]TDD06569.1 hypothetical protein E1294_48805 [Nonomuraea diastatica]